ncbi:MAG TPA: AMP-binding protein [Candidatus Paceibacterota bacterium]|nr:AMP-binding protein [Candidatus Paceibacterota bacterium]
MKASSSKPESYLERIKAIGCDFEPAAFQTIYEQSVADFGETFWSDCTEALVWRQPYTELYVLAPEQRAWFVDGQVNYHQSIFKPERADTEALVWYTKDGNREAMTFAVLEANVQRVANFLRETGVTPGTTLCLATENRRIGALYALACLSLGVRFCFSYFKLPNEVLRHQLRSLGVSTLIVETSIRPEQATVSLSDIASLERVFTVEADTHLVDVAETVSVTSLPALDALPDAPDSCTPYSWPAEAPTIYGFTSGTTATPKAIPLGTAGHYVVGVTTHYLLFHTNRRKVLFAMDFAWGVASIPCFFAPLIAGETVVIDERFFVPGAPHTFATIGQEGIGASYIPIAMLEADHSQAEGTYDFTKVVLGGMELSQAALDGCIALFDNPGRAIYFGYGSSELGGLTLFQVAKGTASMEDFKQLRPAPGVRYEVQNGETNEAGVLQIHAQLPSICQEITGAKEAFAAQWSADGMWFMTDDVAIDHGDTITLCGRTDHMIKVKGRFLDLSLYEQTVQTLTGQAAKLLNTAAAGEAQHLVLFIEGTADATLSERVEKQVVETFGAYAKPHDVQYVPEFPRTVSHKVQAAELTKYYAATKE